MGKIYIVQHCRANNDTYGNPRRCWTIDAIAEGAGGSSRVAHRVAVFDEGYGTSLSHVAAWIWRRADAVQVVEIQSADITPGKYRDLIEAGEHLDETNPFRTVFDDGSHHAFHASRESARREVKRLAAVSALKIEKNGDELHYPASLGGGHRGTAPTTDGAALSRFERKMAEHRADGHSHHN